MIMGRLTRRKAMRAAAAGGVAALAGLGALAQEEKAQGVQAEGEQEALRGLEAELAELPAADEAGEEVPAAELPRLRRAYVSPVFGGFLAAVRSRTICRFRGVHIATSMTIRQDRYWYICQLNGLPRSLGRITVYLLKRPWYHQYYSVVLRQREPTTGRIVDYRDDHATAGYAIGDLG
jgi:hypothetical protein